MSCDCEMPYNQRGAVYRDGGWMVCPTCHGELAKGSKCWSLDVHDCLAKAGILKPISNRQRLVWKLKHWIWWKSVEIRCWWSWKMNWLFRPEETRKAVEFFTGTWTISDTNSDTNGDT